MRPWEARQWTTNPLQIALLWRRHILHIDHEVASKRRCAARRSRRGRRDYLGDALSADGGRKGEQSERVLHLDEVANMIIYRIDDF